MDSIAPPHRSSLLVLAALYGLVGFAFTQPILSVFGQNPSVFSVANVEEGSLILLVAALTVLPALILWVGWLLARRLAPDVARGLLAVIAGFLVGLAAMQWGKSAGLDAPAVRTLVAVAGSVAFGVGFARVPEVLSWAALTAPLPFLGALLMLFSSPTADLIGQPELNFEPGTPGADQPSVVVVVLDELPTMSLLDANREIDAERFPNLAEFSATSTWYRNFTTIAPNTTAAVPAMLSGRLHIDGAAVYANYPDNMFTAFASTHHLAAFESVTSLCNFSLCSETGSNSDSAGRDPDYSQVLRRIGSVWRDRVHPGRDPEIRYDEFEEEIIPNPPKAVPSDSGGAFAGFAQDAVLAKPERFRDFLAVLEPGDPTLYFLHLVLPHSPWRFYPSGQDYDTTAFFPDLPYPFAGANDEGAAIAALTQQRHLLQTQYVDRLIGEMMDRLKGQAMFDDTLIVVVADHGASFEPNTSFRSAEQSSLESVAYVPLLIKQPGQVAGDISDENLSMIDVLPTVAALANVPVGFDVEGFEAGSPQIAARGVEKSMFETAGSLGGREASSEPVVFSIPDTMPTEDMRLIGSLRGSSDPLAGHHAFVGVSNLIGTEFSPARESSATALISGLKGYSSPTGSRLGIVNGRIDGAVVDGPVVIVVNGVIVAGSPIEPFGDHDQFFATMLPAEFVNQSIVLQVALVTDAGLIEVPVEDWNG